MLQISLLFFLYVFSEPLIKLFFSFASVSDSKYGCVEASDLTFCKSTFSKNEKVYSFTFCQIKESGEIYFFL